MIHFRILSALLVATLGLSLQAHAQELQDLVEPEQPFAEVFDADSVAQTLGIDGIFSPMKGSKPNAGYLHYYNANGRPKFNFLDHIKRRFSDHLDKHQDLSQMPTNDQIKWRKIYAELKKAGDRTIPTPKAILMIPSLRALACSLGYEKDRSICPTGAWTVAVQETAVRHGFAKTPCAEFMSEIIRQAYKRAGYRVTDDFNASRGNELIWSAGTAAVVNLSAALNKAGWIAWDTTKYRPVVGAIVMNGWGETPGHTFMAAGDDGRFIIDNAAPQGRDLESVSRKTIGMMYQEGVFFLPPGFNPPTWAR